MTKQEYLKLTNEEKCLLLGLKLQEAAGQGVEAFGSMMEDLAAIGAVDRDALATYESLPLRDRMKIAGLIGLVAPNTPDDVKVRARALLKNQ